MHQIYAIFRNTLLEALRQPLYCLVLLLTCGMIAVTPAMAAHIYTFGAGTGLEHAAERMVADLGLATMLFAGLVLAVFTSANVVGREIEEKTALTVLSKKVGRTAFVLGKYAGVAGAILLATVTCTMVLLLTVRMGAAVSVGDPYDYGVVGGMAGAVLLAVVGATIRNYYQGRSWIGSFTLLFVAGLLLLFLALSLFDKQYNFILLPTPEPEPGAFAGEGTGVTYDWEVARAAVLTIEAVLIMAGVAVAASSRLGTGGNLAASTVVFLGGLTSEYFCGKYAQGTILGRLWYAAVPNLQTFWMSDALTRERPIPTIYLLHASAYAVCYITAMLFLAAFLFQRREIA